jgi:hypothetical protein
MSPGLNSNYGGFNTHAGSVREDGTEKSRHVKSKSSFVDGSSALRHLKSGGSRINSSLNRNGVHNLTQSHSTLNKKGKKLPMAFMMQQEMKSGQQFLKEAGVGRNRPMTGKVHPTADKNILPQTKSNNLIYGSQ